MSKADIADAPGMLYLLPTSGEYDIVKQAKYGVYVKIGKSNVFLPWSVITKTDDNQVGGTD